jgi:CRP-like cAMP-binding protein
LLGIGLVEPVEVAPERRQSLQLAFTRALRPGSKTLAPLRRQRPIAAGGREQGESLFVPVHGSVKVWVRDPSGRNVRVCCLDEGRFSGEVDAISGRRRCASVTAADRCVLLEINRDDLAAIRSSHPHIGEVIEAQLVTRTVPKPPAKLA